jgi:Domain of unknown function (DUF1707)/Domain of unknown function (DUF4333)
MMQPGSWYQDSTRASDADRADVCAILDNAYATGELDGEEHRRRCSSAMSAKTRGQLVQMVSDLQARPPVFSQQPAIAVKDNPNRKWIVAASVGGGLTAAGILGYVVLTWHSGSSPTPTAPVAAPTASVAAPTETHSSDITGTFLPLVEVVGDASGAFQDSIGHAPERVDCPGDLAGQVGASERCSIADKGKQYTASVTVTAVSGNRITTQTWIDDVVSPPPNRP